MTIIRRASPEDVPIAQAIIRDALAAYGLPFEPDGRDADVRYFGGRSDHDDFLAIRGDEDDARIAGIASVGPHGDEGVAWVSKLFVDANARRRGVGRALLRATHEAARARGYRRVGLRTRVVFTEAIRLYESEGYVRLLGGGGGNGDDALLETGDVVYFREL